MWWPSMPDYRYGPPEVWRRSTLDKLAYRGPILTSWAGTLRMTDGIELEAWESFLIDLAVRKGPYQKWAQGELVVWASRMYLIGHAPPPVQAAVRQCVAEPAVGVPNRPCLIRRQLKTYCEYRFLAELLEYGSPKARELLAQWLTDWLTDAPRQLLLKYMECKHDKVEELLAEWPPYTIGLCGPYKQGHSEGPCASV